MRLEITIPGDPVTTARARFSSRGGFGVVYTPAKSIQYQNVVATYVQAASSERGLRYTFRVEAKFFKAGRQRTDIDNLLKSVLDGCTRSGIWADDSQVREVSAKLLLAQDEPRLELVLEEVEDGSPKWPLCKTCGKEIKRAYKYPGVNRESCSKACRYAEKSLKCVCPVCSAEFWLAKSTAKLRETCSKRCSTLVRRGRPRGKIGQKFVSTDPEVVRK